MATRSQRRIADQSGESEPAELLDADFADVSKMIDEQERTENEIDTEMGDDTGSVRFKLKVYQLDPKGRDMAFLFEVIGESIEGMAERLRDDYGTGKYLIRKYRDDNDGKGFVMRKARGLKIVAPNRAISAATDHGGSALVQAVAQQGAILQQLVTRLATMPPPAPAPAQNMTEMMMGFAAAMKAMREINPPPPPPPPPLPPPDPMAIMSSAIEMARSLADNDRPKSMMEVVGEFMQSDLMKTVVQNAQQSQAAPPQIQQRPPQRPQIPNAVPSATPAASAPAPAAAPAAPPQDDSAAKFSALLQMLITRAENNSDPVLYADFIEDMVDRPTLEGLLSLPDPVGALAQANPAVAIHREWFADLLKALTDTEDGVEPPSALDHTADTSLAATSARPSPVPADGSA